MCEETYFICIYIYIYIRHIQVLTASLWSINRCKEMRPTYHDTSAIEERSLSLTGSKIPLVNRFAQSPNPEPSIAIGIAIMTEEACKCSSSMNDHNVGREGGVVSRPGFSDINALGELLPVILPFADHWYAHYSLM